MDQSLLYNPNCEFSNDLIAFIGMKFESHGNTSYTIGEMKYAPVTADIAVQKQNEVRFFIEMKTRKCRVLSNGREDVRVNHARGHTRDQPDTFSYTSGRWTYLLTELLKRDGATDRFMEGGKSYPRKMLLIHRDQIPGSWWYGTGNAQGEVTGLFPQDCVLDLQQDFVSQMIKLFDRSGQFNPELPALEDMDVVSTEKLLSTGRNLWHRSPKLQNSLSREQHTFSAHEEVRKRLPDYVHQSKASLALLRQCRIAYVLFIILSQP